MVSRNFPVVVFWVLFYYRFIPTKFKSHLSTILISKINNRHLIDVTEGSSEIYKVYICYIFLSWDDIGVKPRPLI